jgi:hypothetical protein
MKIYVTFVATHEQEIGTYQIYLANNQAACTMHNRGGA